MSMGITNTWVFLSNEGQMKQRWHMLKKDFDNIKKNIYTLCEEVCHDYNIRTNKNIMRKTKY